MTPTRSPYRFLFSILLCTVFFLIGMSPLPLHAQTNGHTQEHAVTPFEEIVLRGFFTTKIYQNDEYKVIFHTPTEFEQILQLKQKRNKITIQTSRNSSNALDTKKQMIVEIYTPSIQDIHITHTDVEFHTPLQIKDLSITLEGMSNISALEYITGTSLSVVANNLTLFRSVPSHTNNISLQSLKVTDIYFTLSGNHNLSWDEINSHNIEGKIHGNNTLIGNMLAAATISLVLKDHNVVNISTIDSGDLSISMEKQNTLISSYINSDNITLDIIGTNDIHVTSFYNTFISRFVVGSSSQSIRMPLLKSSILDIYNKGKVHIENADIENVLQLESFGNATTTIDNGNAQEATLLLNNQSTLRAENLNIREAEMYLLNTAYATIHVLDILVLPKKSRQSTYDLKGEPTILKKREKQTN